MQPYLRARGRGVLAPVPRRTLLKAALLAPVLALAFPGGVARANRFGPPWQARITAEQTVAYTAPDRSAEPVGPLFASAIVVVLGELKGADGADWTATLNGFVPSADLVEDYAPWEAEVVVPSAAIYAKPTPRQGIRRNAEQGDLLRVTGVSPGLEGDRGIWWSSTEGYLPMGSLGAATSEWAQGWRLPDPAEAVQGWWGSVRQGANVRAAATTEAPVVGYFAGGERVKVLAEEEGEDVEGSATWYRIDGGRYAGARIHSSLVTRLPEPAPHLGGGLAGSTSDLYLVINRAALTLTVVQEGRPTFATYVALGLAGVQTPGGRYSTYGKFSVDDMTSTSVPDAQAPYDLPNVPHVQYYLDGGFAIHGTYWHDFYGTNQSQGCVNITLTDAAHLFALTQPHLAEGALFRWATDVPATPVLIVN